MGESYIHKTEHHLVIDSRKRDLSRYPEQSSYRFDLPERLSNIVAIKLEAVRYLGEQPTGLWLLSCREIPHEHLSNNEMIRESMMIVGPTNHGALENALTFHQPIRSLDRMTLSWRPLDENSNEEKDEDQDEEKENQEETLPEHLLVLKVTCKVEALHTRFQK